MLTSRLPGQEAQNPKLVEASAKPGETALVEMSGVASEMMMKLGMPPILVWCIMIYILMNHEKHEKREFCRVFMSVSDS